MLKNCCFAKSISRSFLFTPCCLCFLHSFIVSICLACCLLYYSALLVSRQPDLAGRSCCAEIHTHILVSHQWLVEDEPSLQHLLLQGLFLCHEEAKSYVPTPTNCISLFQCNSPLVSPARYGLPPLSLPLDVAGPWVRRGTWVTQSLP